MKIKRQNAAFGIYYLVFGALYNEDTILDHMLFYKVCFPHQYLRFEPTPMPLGQFSIFHRRIFRSDGVVIKKGRAAPLIFFKKSPKKITDIFTHKGTQINHWSKVFQKNSNFEPPYHYMYLSFLHSFFIRYLGRR